MTSQLTIEHEVPLAPRTTLGVGGSARHFARITSEAALLEALAWASSRSLALRVLGGGSNLVIADAGFDGLVLELALAGHRFEQQGDFVDVHAAAGEPWDDFVAATVARGLQGLECLSGIPGRVGATPIQNVGAYGQEVSETIVDVTAIDRTNGSRVTLTKDECGFGYRESRFKSREPSRYVVTEVRFRLRRDAPPAVRYAELERAFTGKPAPTLAEVRETVIALRRSKSMVLDANDPNSRSCGSFFVNPVLSAEACAAFNERARDEGAIPTFPQSDGRTKLSAGWLIEHAGFARGTRDGAVGLSTKHALALVAHAGARAADVLRFAERVRAGVHARFGVNLQPEPVFWGFDS